MGTQQAIDDRRRMLRDVARTEFLNPAPAIVARDVPLLRSVDAAARKLERHEIHALLDVGPGKSVEVVPENPAQFDATVRALFGKDLYHDQLANLAGAIRESKVTVSTSETSLTFETKASGRATRKTIIWKDEKGRLRLHIQRTDSDVPGRGTGTRMTARQILQAKLLGVRAADLSASREKGDTGYIVWPKLGFDAKLPPMWIAAHRSELARLPFPVTRISDLYGTKEGEALWARYGETMTLTMSLRDQSKGLQTMAKYVQGKREEWAPEAVEAAHHDIDIEADWPLLDRIWQEIRELEQSGVVFTYWDEEA